MIHSHNLEPDDATDGVFVSPDGTTYIGVTVVNTYRLVLLTEMSKICSVSLAVDSSHCLVVKASIWARAQIHNQWLRKADQFVLCVCTVQRRSKGSIRQTFI